MFVKKLPTSRPDAPTRGLALDARVHEALQCYVSLLETLCRESPYNWFNFFDFWATDDADFPAPP